jgi:hypothetical protein
MKQAQKIVKDSSIGSVQHLKQRVREFEQIKMLTSATEAKIEEEKKNQFRSEQAIKNYEDEITALERGAEYKKTLDAVSEKKKLEQHLREEERSPLHYFSTLNDALKKYERISLNTELVKAYVENPLQALEQDASLKIREIVQKVKQAVLDGTIELKQDKKKKTIEACDSFDADSFRSFLERKKEIDTKMNVLQTFLDHETTTEHIESLRDQIDHEKKKITEGKIRQKKLEQEQASRAADVLKKELEDGLLDVMNERVQII